MAQDDLTDAREARGDAANLGQNRPKSWPLGPTVTNR
jgi:hypothetical protein